MSNKPRPIEKNAYLLARVRFLEDQLTVLQANVGRIGDYLGFVGEQLQKIDGMLTPTTEAEPTREPSAAAAENIAEAEATEPKAVQLELVP